MDVVKYFMFIICIVLVEEIVIETLFHIKRNLEQAFKTKTSYFFVSIIIVLL